MSLHFITSALVSEHRVARKGRFLVASTTHATPGETFSPLSHLVNVIYAYTSPSVLCFASFTPFLFCHFAIFPYALVNVY